MRRRSLLQLVLGTLSTPPWLRGLGWAQPRSSLAPERRATLEALAQVVLPASLGRERTLEITAGFSRWLAGYRAQAELDHGYGHPKLRAAGPAPDGDYARQLLALERAAGAQGVSFARLSPERQRALVAAALTAARVEELPERPDGRHVASDLLAFFFRSGEANDLCYGAAIGRDTCRGLPGSEVPPPPLGEDH